LGAFAAAIVAFILSAGFRDWMEDLFRGGQSPPRKTDAERIVAPARADIWAGKPVLFPDSFEALVRRFSEFDPRRVHDMRKDGQRATVSALVAAGAQ
jgi:hypothetical protein